MRLRKILEKLATIDGLPPNLMNPPEGCRFAARCPIVKEKCKASPFLTELDKKTLSSVSCWYHKDAEKNGSKMYEAGEKTIKNKPKTSSKPKGSALVLSTSIVCG